eukprot:Nk52_evm27s343 gene=Nk52_evmTU27s343
MVIVNINEVQEASYNRRFSRRNSVAIDEKDSEIEIEDLQSDLQAHMVWKPTLRRKRVAWDRENSVDWSSFDKKQREVRKNRKRIIVGHTNRRRFDENPGFYHHHSIPPKSLYEDVVKKNIMADVFCSNYVNTHNVAMEYVNEDEELLERAPSAPPIAAVSQAQEIIDQKLKGKIQIRARPKTAGQEASARLSSTFTKSFESYRAVSGRAASAKKIVDAQINLFQRPVRPTPFDAKGSSYPAHFTVLIDEKKYKGQGKSELFSEQEFDSSNYSKHLKRQTLHTLKEEEMERHRRKDMKIKMVFEARSKMIQKMKRSVEEVHIVAYIQIAEDKYKMRMELRKKNHQKYFTSSHIF